MAFNPFAWFRKQQKVMIAALAVMCMIIFVFQFGPGDLFSRVGGLFGRNRQTGDLVTTVNGKKVYSSDIEQLAMQRRLASDFLFQEVYLAHPQALKELLDGPLKPSDEGGGPMGEAIRIAQACQRRMSMREMGAPGGGRGGQVLGLFADMFERSPASLLVALRQDLQELEAMAGRQEFKDKPERLAAINKLATVIGFQTWLVCRSPSDFARISGQAGRVLPPEEYYFGGSRKTDDLLDFMVLRTQAKKLKIEYTDDDVLRLVSAEAGGQQLFEGKRFAREKRVEEFLQTWSAARSFTAADLLNALREEFQVAATAERLMLGHVAIDLPLLAGEGGRPLDERDGQRPGFDFIPSTLGVRAYRGMLVSSAIIAAPTPDEFLEYYREQSTSLRVRMLPVPAAKFLDQVQGAPSEEELRARFERRKKEEPRPSSREPGFKQPRRIALEGVTVNVTAPHFVRLGREERLVRQAIAPIGLTGVGTALVFAFADPVVREYHGAYLDQVPNWLPLRTPFQMPGMPQQSRDWRLHLSSLLDAGVVSRGVAGMALAGQGLTALPAALTTWFGSAAVLETRQTKILALTALLGRADPQALLTVPGLLAARYPQALPYDTLRPLIVAGLDEEWAFLHAKKALIKLRTDLEKLPSQDRDAKARELIAKAVKEHQLRPFTVARPVSTEELKDQLQHGGSPDLDALRDAHYREMYSVQRQMDEIYRNMGMMDRFGRDMEATRKAVIRQYTPTPDTFAFKLFGSKGLYKMEPISMRGALDDSLGEAPGGDYAVFWLTADQPARELSFAEARPAVEAAWRLEKARQKAREQAEAIEKQINGKNLTAAEAVGVLGKQGETFELDNVAPMVQPREALFRATGSYKPYEVPESARGNLRYPPRELARQLQVLRRPGDATVVADQPTDVWYVAVLEGREVPTVQQFRDVYERSPHSDPLFSKLLAERSRELRQALLVQLRREAGEVESSGRFKLPTGARERDTGRSSEE